LNKIILDSIKYSWSIKIFNQIPSSYYLFVKSNYPEIITDETIFFKGTNSEDVLKHYLETIDNLNEKFNNLLKIEKEINMTEEDENHFNETNICWMCEKEIKSIHVKVGDHDHFNGKYRGAAHYVCNINCKKPKRIPIIFHSGSNYDNHLFIKALAEYGKNKKINVIGKITEEYLSIRYGSLSFIDS